MIKAQRKDHEELSFSLKLYEKNSDTTNIINIIEFYVGQGVQYHRGTLGRLKSFKNGGNEKIDIFYPKKTCLDVSNGSVFNFF